LRIEGKRVLVTGGAGFIGGHLVERLAQSNDVTVLDDFTVGTEENIRSADHPVRVLRADVRDPAPVGEAVQQADVVFHLAAVNLRESITDPVHNHLVNDLGTLNLLLAARECSLERFVCISSSEVYGSARWTPMDEDHPTLPTTPYGASKLAAEALALSFHCTYGLPAVVVRPFNAYGPRGHVDGPSGEVIPRFVRRAMAGKPLVIFGDGMQTRDFTWVEDTVHGILLAAECDELVGGRVNIARGESVRILQVAQLVMQLVGSTVPIEHHPERPGDVRRQRAGVDRAQSVLGFAAAVGIEEGLTRYVEWVRAEPRSGFSGQGSEEVMNWALAPASC
jgi:UDP-glucose 4-epimerase